MGDFRLLRLIIGRHAIWLHYTNSPRWNKKRAHFDGYPCHVATSFTSYSDVCEKFRVPVPRTIKNKLKNIWLPLKKNQPKATSFPKIHHQFHAIQTGTEFGQVHHESPHGSPPPGRHVLDFLMDFDGVWGFESLNDGPPLVVHRCPQFAMENGLLNRSIIFSRASCFTLGIGWVRSPQSIQ